MTLTELLIVVSIIAFLSILVTGFLRTQVFKGNDAKRKADINKIGIALEEYEKDNNCYPLPSLVVCKPNNNGLTPYLNNIPCDPITKTSYFYETDGNLSCPRWYRIYASLENDKDVDYTAGIGNNNLYSYYQSSPNAPSLDLGGNGNETTWGCFNGSCQPIQTGQCTPMFQRADCLGNCVDSQGNPKSECN